MNLLLHIHKIFNPCKIVRPSLKWKRRKLWQKVCFYKYVTQRHYWFPFWGNVYIYVYLKLKPIWKQSVFKKLLFKLITECKFCDYRKIKRVDSVSMWRTLSVIFRLFHEQNRKRRWITNKTEILRTIPWC